MKTKTGMCIECGNSGGLIARRCRSCYWRYREKVKKEKPLNKLKNIKKAIEKKELDVFFANQILQIPSHCEECGINITGWKHTGPKLLIAHILPKRKLYGFPEVATHPQNRMFFCPQCHADFDNKGSEHVAKMRSLKTIKSRLKKFINKLSEADRERVPEILK